LLEQGGQIDGFGIGTRFAVSRFAPAIEIIYKIVQYGSTSTGKGKYYERDIICRFPQSGVPPLQPHPAMLGLDQNPPLAGSNAGSRSKPAVGGDDLLKPFARTCAARTENAGTGESVEQIQTIQKRLATELSLLDDSIKAIRNPEKYHVEFA